MVKNRHKRGSHAQKINFFMGRMPMNKGISEANTLYSKDSIMKNKFLSIGEKACRHSLILIFLCFFSINPVIAQTPDDYWPPWATKTTTNSATINWRGNNMNWAL
jgi:hypothetical protein